MAQAVLTALGDEPFLTGIGAAGRARVERHYSEEVMVNAYERLYRHSLNPPTRAP
jgi:glycosyltransferase involved in cell wall biosynthesis